MKASDTVNPYYLKDIEGGYYNKYPEFQVWEDGKKAGIKEVVEWGKETCPHDIFGEGTHCFKRACDLCWQTKIKEWGIHDKPKRANPRRVF